MGALLQDDAHTRAVTICLQRLQLKYDELLSGFYETRVAKKHLVPALETTMR